MPLVGASASIAHLVEEVNAAGWSFIRDGIRGFVRSMMETMLKAEQQQHMACQPYERTPRRRTSANGYYHRSLSSSFGVIEHLRVPRVRTGRFLSQLWQRYHRRTQELDASLLLWYLQGESCRDVVRSLRLWSKDVLSPQSVSRLIQRMDSQLRTWRERPFTTPYQAVWLDGFCVKVRFKRHIHATTILAALGRRDDGQWEVLSFRLAEAESERRWMELLHQMHRRGMRTELFIHDGAEGIAEALRWDYHTVPTQRCLVHKLRNLLELVNHPDHRQIIKHEFWHVYNATTLGLARRRFNSFCKRWSNRERPLVVSWSQVWLQTTAFFALPERLRAICRSTNMMEFLFRELRRRTKVIGVFPTPQSCERIVFLSLMMIEHVHLNRNQNMPSFLSTFTQD